MKEEKAIKTFNNYINAIETFGTIDPKCCNNLYEPAITLLNLIETQKAEIDAKRFDIEALKEERENDINKIEKKDKRISDLEFALMDMVLQFADEDKEQINTMGLSALEIAFTELDLYDPIDRKEVEKKYAELAAKYYGLVEGEERDNAQKKEI